MIYSTCIDATDASAVYSTTKRHFFRLLSFCDNFWGNTATIEKYPLMRNCHSDRHFSEKYIRHKRGLISLLRNANIFTRVTVASLGLVSPGAATDSVTLLPKNWRPFLVIASGEWWPFLAVVSLPPRVTPSRGWHPAKIIFLWLNLKKR